MAYKSTMKKNEKKSRAAPPAAVEEILHLLGHNIRIARLRRKLRLEDLAERVGVSRFLIAGIEKGKSSTSIGAYVSALWVLGLSDDMSKIAEPDEDFEGKALEDIRAPKTAPKRKKVLDNDF